MTPTTTHTPGPWRIGDAGRTVFGPKMPDGSAPVIIANCDYQQSKVNGSKRANARLIATAPDLLAACKAALVVLMADSDSEEDNAEEIASLKAAIARAEGE